MKKIITAATNLVTLQKKDKDCEAKKAFLLFNPKDKKAILNTIDILHGGIFSEIFN